MNLCLPGSNSIVLLFFISSWSCTLYNLFWSDSSSPFQHFPDSLHLLFASNFASWFAAIVVCLLDNTNLCYTNIFGCVAFHWSVSHLSVVKLLEKTDFSFLQLHASSHSSVRGGKSYSMFSSLLGLRLIQVFTGLMHGAPSTVRSDVQLPYCVHKTLCSCSHLLPLLLLHQRTLFFQGRLAVYKFHVWLSILQSFILYILTCGGSLCWLPSAANIISLMRLERLFIYKHNDRSLLG